MNGTVYGCAIYQQDGAFAVDDPDGTQIAAGLRDEAHAAQVAADYAERQGDEPKANEEDMTMNKSSNMSVSAATKAIESLEFREELESVATQGWRGEVPGDVAAEFGDGSLAALQAAAKLALEAT